jgi:hypothetical protein
VPNPRTYILWAALLAALPSCGGDGAGTRTCIAVTVTYSGSKPGPAYLRVRESDGGSFGVNAPSIQILIWGSTGSVVCAYSSSRPDVSFTAAAWIDVSGSSAANCANLSSNPQCQPSPSDPQGHQSGVERAGQLTKIQLDLVDPP